MLHATVSLRVVPAYPDPNHANSGRAGGWVAGTPFKAVDQGTGEFLVRHARGLPPEVFYQPHLLAGELVAVPGKRALEVLPHVPQEVLVPHGLASHLSQNVLAHAPPSGTTAVAASVCRGTRRRSLSHGTEKRGHVIPPHHAYLLPSETPTTTL